MADPQVDPKAVERFVWTKDDIVIVKKAMAKSVADEVRDRLTARST